MANVRRTLRAKFGARKNPLPPKLSFLEGVKFYSVAKHDGKRQERIEFLPGPLKSIIALAKTSDDIVVENEVLLKEVSSLRRDISDREDELARLRAANEQLMVNLLDYEGMMNAPAKSDMGTYIDIANKRAFKVTGRTRQGGAPGLGRNR